MAVLELTINDRNKLNTSDSVNASIKINSMDETPIIIEDDLMSNSVKIFKTVLIALMLYDTIDFLRNELEERNLHTRTLLLRDANDGRSIDAELLDYSNDLSVATTLALADSSSSNEMSSTVEFSNDDNNIEAVCNGSTNSLHENSIIPLVNEINYMSFESISEFHFTTLDNYSNKDDDSDLLIVDNSYHADNQRSSSDIELETSTLSNDFSEKYVESNNNSISRRNTLQSVNDQINEYRNFSHSNYLVQLQLKKRNSAEKLKLID